MKVAPLGNSALILAVGIFITSLLNACSQIPLPADISIVPPSSAVASNNAAAFSGAWLGWWDDALPSALIVEKISADGQVQVIYSWGDEFNIHQGWSRETGRIIDGQLHLTPTNGINRTFWLAPNGNLLGSYEMAETPPSVIEMVHLPDTNAPAILAAARAVPVTWNQTVIPVHSQVGPTAGKTFQLQTTIYPQSSPGRHPVLIFNHGSTGPGLIPTNMVFRAGREKPLFQSLGYIEVVPMRKGRGASEGPDLEEDETVSADIQLSSAVEDLQAVVAYLRQQPDVDASRILVAGVSRGGMLSVAYAGRYPTNVIGVINFSGGWYGETIIDKFTSSSFNFASFRAAGHNAKVPMLWLYADHDSYYTLKYVEREFTAFRTAGGLGELYQVRDLPGEGHRLCYWPAKWQDKVTLYLHAIAEKNQ